MTNPKLRTKTLIPAALLLASVLVAGYFAWQKFMPNIAGPIRVTAQPQKIWIEAGDTAQSLNFDFLVENLGPTPLGIDSIELSVMDSGGKPVLRRFIDGNGFAPGIETVPMRTVAPGAKILVFNPFHSFRPDMDLHTLTYQFGMSIPQEAPEAHTTVTVEPQVYRGKTVLSFPVKGLFMIHDGHDFYAHHRRLNTEHVAAKDLGLTQNFMRYSLDINPSNDHFDIFRSTGAKNEDWYAWGQPLYATGDGTVVDAADVEPDNIRGGESFFSVAKVKAAPMQFYGNYLVIDHGNGEFSLLGHIQKGSLSVKVGDKVQRGQLVARIGNSGSSNNPHVHYELRTGKDLKAEGLPGNFVGYRRHLGSKVLAVDAGPVDTGDLLETP
jgi:hypothetical protein